MPHRASALLIRLPHFFAVAALLAARPAAARPDLYFVLAPAGTPPGARLASPSVSLSNLGEGPVVIEAPTITREETGGRTVASGGAILTQGPARMTADTLTYDPDTRDVVAEGDVVYTDPERTARGQRLAYNVDARRVRATEVVTVVRGVIVRARNVDATQTLYTATGATFTTCDLPHPHYLVSARSVVMTPDNRVVARDVGVSLFGVKLMVVPRLSGHIGSGGDEGRSSPFPRFGRNSRDGFFIGQIFPLVRQPSLFLNLDARLAVRRGLLGGFDAAAPLGRGVQAMGSLKYRDEAPNQRTRFEEVDRLPEVGILVTSPPPAPRRVRRPRTPRVPRSSPSSPAAPTQADQQPATGAGQPATAAPFPEPDFIPQRVVGSDVEHQPGLLRPPRAGPWFLRAQTTIGYFRQREQNTVSGESESMSGGRLDIRATATRSGAHLFGVGLPIMQLFFRQSFYDTGDAYTVLGFGARQDWRLGPHWATSLRAFLHRTLGETPFSFDRVEIRAELQPGFAYRAGGTTYSWLGRMDLDRRQLYDQEFAIARVFHCLEPRLSYRTRHRQIGLDVRVVGLQFD
jgi:hypothetical protein